MSCGQKTSQSMSLRRVWSSDWLREPECVQGRALGGGHGPGGGEGPSHCVSGRDNDQATRSSILSLLLPRASS